MVGGLTLVGLGAPLGILPIYANLLKVARYASIAATAIWGA
jgi:hypothetical protein